MVTRISIADLIKRTRDHSGRHDGGEQALPDVLAESLPLWESLSERLQDELGAMLEVDVDVAFTFQLSQEKAFRQDNKKPGIIIPFGDDMSDTFICLTGQSARVLSDRLVRSIANEDETEAIGTLSGQDGVLIRELIETLSTLMDKAFSMPLPLNDHIEPVLQWPLQPASSHTRAVLHLSLSLSSSDKADIYVVFANDLVDFFSSSVRDGAKAIEAASVSLNVTGVLSRWYADESEMVSLSPGSMIVIPGGDLENVTIEIDNDESVVIVGQAELGTSKGRHALKITAANLTA